MEEQLELNFETGRINRGEMELMTLEELLFLLGSAIQYNSMFPIPESETFVNTLRETVGTGFTSEQYEDFKKEMQKFMNNEN